jgi:hypothetical protein
MTKDAQIKELRRKVRALTAQLPRGMKRCTIQFRACVKGHGSLTAKNWTQHPCLVCGRDAMREELMSQSASLIRLETFRQDVAQAVGLLPGDLIVDADLITAVTLMREMLKPASPDPVRPSEQETEELRKQKAWIATGPGPVARWTREYGS